MKANMERPDFDSLDMSRKGMLARRLEWNWRSSVKNNKEIY